MQINYLMYANALTGDSNITFFPTAELAQKTFNIYTEPLVAICMNNYYNTDTQDVFTTLKDGKAYRFNAGELEPLDDRIGDSNVYYEWNTIEVPNNTTHYLAQFSEWVDDSCISFHTENNALTIYNNLILEQIDIAKNHHNITINRTSQTDHFSETNNPIDNHTDAFFGYDDVYNTIRIGSIHIKGDN